MKPKYNDPWIWTSSNVLSENFCKKVIDKFELSTNDHRQGQIYSGVNTDIKRSTDLFITTLTDWKDEHSVFHETLIKKFEEYSYHLTKYFHSRKVNQVYDFLIPGDAPLFFSSGHQVQRTNPKEFYTWHNDSLHCQQFYRVFTYIFYLNDVKSGGQTEFINGEKIRPEQGKLLIFPATETYMHRGVSPSSGVKYISVGWMCKINDDQSNTNNVEILQ